MGDKQMKGPTPIRVSELPWRSDGEPLVCWQYNEHRAKDLWMNDPVTKVWATRGTLYSSDPSQSKNPHGSRSIGNLYRTEAEAWEACLVAVERSFEKRLGEIRDAMEKAQEAERQPPNERSEDGK